MYTVNNEFLGHDNENRYNMLDFKIKYLIPFITTIALYQNYKIPFYIQPQFENSMKLVL